MLKLLKRLAARTDGQDIIEYALLAGFISVTVLVALGGIGGNVGDTYGKVSTSVAAANVAGDSGQAGAGTGNGNGNNGNGNGNGGGNGSTGSGNGAGNNGSGNGNGGGNGSSGGGNGSGNNGSGNGNGGAGS